MTETAPHATITAMETFAITLTILNLVLLLTFTITDRIKPSTSVKQAIELHRSAEGIEDAYLRAKSTEFTHDQLKAELELSRSVFGRIRHLLPAVLVIWIGSFGTVMAIGIGYDEPPTGEVGFIVAALIFLLSSATMPLLLIIPIIFDLYRMIKERKRRKNAEAPSSNDD